MAQYANVSSIPLSIAVFLASDFYDHNSDPYTISVTTLLKPVRQVILASRVPPEAAPPDLMSMMPSRIGTAIHDAIESAWATNHRQALQAIGIPKKVAEHVLINPKPEELYDGCIPVYFEQRVSKQVGKWTVSGKYDFVGDGIPEDFKSTSTYSAVNGNNDDKHCWQLSLYRWLNPDIITKDTGKIQFIFTDWSQAKAQQDPSYPRSRHLERIHQLKPINEVEQFVRRKLALLEQYWDAPEEQIPECSDQDLWRSDPVYKYYKDPAKAAEGGRSTKNFDSEAEAHTHRISIGSGVVITKPGEVKACKHCSAFPVCTQKDALIIKGELVL